MRVKLLATMAMSAMAVSCADKREPLATIPFDVSRSGHSVAIPVDVSRENADLDVEYVVGVFLWNPDRDSRLGLLRSYPPRQRLYLRVKVWRLVGQGEFAVRVNDRDFNYDVSTDAFSLLPSMGDRKTDVAYVRSSGAIRDVIHMESAHFRFPEYGRYRIEVSTVADTPMLHSIPSWLTVQRDFPHGK